LDGDLEPAGGAEGDGEDSVVCSGDAVDDGEAEADTGRADAVDHGCPAMYADPTHDPRMPS
jgi:hypothetical protein